MSSHRRVRGTCPAHTKRVTGCERCRAAYRRWQAGYALDLLEGQPRTVPVLATQRRLQGLAATGWSCPAVARATGMGVRLVQALRGAEAPRVTTPHAATVARLYARKAGTWGGSSRTANLARQEGWAHPDAWDGLDLTDPDAVPLPPVPLDTERVDSALVLADLEHLIRDGATWWSLRERMRLGPLAVEQRLRRGGRVDLLRVLVRASGGHNAARAAEQDRGVAS